jgi:hypothetical protein
VEKILFVGGVDGGKSDCDAVIEQVQSAEQKGGENQAKNCLRKANAFFVPFGNRIKILRRFFIHAMAGETLQKLYLN